MSCRHKGKLLAGLAAIFLSTAFGSAQPKLGLVPDPAHPLADPGLLGFAVIFQVGFISPMVTALALVLTTTGQAGLPKLLADALSSQPLLQLADISYDIYLVHPLVRISFLKPPTLSYLLVYEEASSRHRKGLDGLGINSDIVKRGP